MKCSSLLPENSLWSFKLRILYVHGFNSSARSFKAGMLRQRVAALGQNAEFVCPDLDSRPKQAMAQLEKLIATPRGKPLALVGSSLGGFYSTWLAEKFGLKAVLVNPAVRPHELLRSCLGRQRNLYTREEYEFTAQHLAELREFEVETVTPTNYLLLVATGDEVLDYRAAVKKYHGCEEVIIEGGDHGFSNFAKHVDAILAFFGHSTPC